MMVTNLVGVEMNWPTYYIKPWSQDDHLRVIPRRDDMGLTLNSFFYGTLEVGIQIIFLSLFKIIFYFINNNRWKKLIIISMNCLDRWLWCHNWLWTALLSTIFNQSWWLIDSDNLSDLTYCYLLASSKVTIKR